MLGAGHVAVKDILAPIVGPLVTCWPKSDCVRADEVQCPPALTQFALAYNLACHAAGSPNSDSARSITFRNSHARISPPRSSAHFASVSRPGASGTRGATAPAGRARRVATILRAVSPAGPARSRRASTFHPIGEPAQCSSRPDLPRRAGADRADDGKLLLS